MQITIDDLMRIIGQLTVENLTLKAQLDAATAKISALTPKQEEPEK